MSRKERLQAQVVALTDELAKIAARPSEPSGDVLTFEKKYASRNYVYRFVARRSAEKLWYVSGSQANVGRLSWDSLLDFIEIDAVNDSIATLKVATRWKALVAK